MKFFKKKKKAKHEVASSCANTSGTYRQINDSVENSTGASVSSNLSQGSVIQNSAHIIEQNASYILQDNKKEESNTRPAWKTSPFTNHREYNDTGESRIQKSKLSNPLVKGKLQVTVRQKQKLESFDYRLNGTISGNDSEVLSQPHQERNISITGNSYDSNCRSLANIASIGNVSSYEETSNSISSTNLELLTEFHEPLKCSTKGRNKGAPSRRKPSKYLKNDEKKTS
ncbi:hypothetical protein [Wolbachia endosymbiont of Pentidionis agamae]|uniref:hypothetical protein n=1 Tax=Wolbachia endosymbiont of Pentidionis agamae TaxID=3110435 RepID=UPI002FD408EE